MKIILSGEDQIVVIAKGNHSSWKAFEDYEKKRLGKSWSKRQRENAQEWLKSIRRVRIKEREHKVRFISNGNEVYFVRR